MSHNWTFSQTSEGLLQKCIAAAPPPDVNNKWILAFRTKNTETEPKHIQTLSSTEGATIISCEVEVKNELENGNEELIDIIHTDLASRWDYLVVECTKNKQLFVLLAECLTTSSIERLCKHVLTTETLEYPFLENYCKLFLLNCLKREYKRFYLEFFLEIHKHYPMLCKILLEMLLKDVDITSDILNDFIISLNEIEQKEFLKKIIFIELPAQNFVHHLPTIYTAYKISSKSNEVQSYTFSKLVQHNSSCRNDRNYGKLFLAYLQTEKDLETDLNVGYIKDLLENHTTPFRKPCEKILDTWNKTPQLTQTGEDI